MVSDSSGEGLDDSARSFRLNGSELLATDIDLRIGADLLAEVWNAGDWSDELVLALARFAYGRGYCDALTEVERGKLCRDHGYAVPQRVAR